MRDHFTITISDDLGSRFYEVKKVYRRIFIAAVVLVLLVSCVAISLNYLQFRHAQWLGKVNRSIDDQLVQLNAENGDLERSLDVQRKELEDISNQLAEMEKISGVESSHYDTGLVERAGLLADFYRQKGQQYPGAGNGLQPIASKAMAEEGSEVTKPAIDEVPQVKMAGLTTNHERILHDSIPSGYPTRSTSISGAFGKRQDPDSGITIFHKGVDLETNSGDPVVATADGIVRETNNTPLTGNRLVVQHNFGFETRYLHLEHFDLAPGDIVHKGDRIGVAGNSHNNGSGLHYEIRYLGRSIDPQQFLQWQFGSHEIFTRVKGIKWPSLISLINKQLPQNLELSGM